jgi:hypothetical protein
VGSSPEYSDMRPSVLYMCVTALNVLGKESRAANSARVFTTDTGLMTVAAIVLASAPIANDDDEDPVAEIDDEACACEVEEGTKTDFNE